MISSKGLCENVKLSAHAQESMLEQRGLQLQRLRLKLDQDPQPMMQVIQIADMLISDAPNLPAQYVCNHSTRATRSFDCDANMYAIAHVQKIGCEKQPPNKT